MGYELRLRPRSGVMTEDRFVEAFNDRRFFSFPESAPDIAAYFSTDTGVYFHLGYLRPDPDEPAGALDFSMNVARPAMFVREADLVLKALIEALDLAVEDPQDEGIVGDTYESDGFLRGWSRLNDLALASMDEDDLGDQPLVLDGDTLDAAWRWNYLREATVRDNGGSYAAPFIRFAFIAGEACTTTEWRIGQSLLLPRADYVVVREASGGAIVPWGEVEAALSLGASRRIDDPSAYWALLDGTAAKVGRRLIQQPRENIEWATLDPATILASRTAR